MHSELNGFPWLFRAASTLPDSGRSGRTRSATISSLGKRKASDVLSVDAFNSSPDSVDEPRLKQAKVSDEPTSRTGLPQDPGKPYIIVRKNNYLKKAKVSLFSRHIVQRYSTSWKQSKYPRVFVMNLLVWFQLVKSTTATSLKERSRPFEVQIRKLQGRFRPSS